MLRDLKASLSVFLVALPLCLGLAIASGAPPISGLIAGIVGGIVIGYLSGSPISVSGPAAGLTIIVLECISKSGGYPQFLTVLIFSGVIQIMIAWLRGGMIGNFFPGSVINGLLSSIGLLLILKQLPHAIGYDKDYEGDDSFIQMSGENTFSGIFSALHAVEIHAVLTFIVAIGCMIYFDKLSKKGNAFAKNVPAPLLAVFFGTAVNLILAKSFPQTPYKRSILFNSPIFQT
jgi:MFS superfamily sulfate permease-like transporter